ncbi:MAG: hypothetical protein Q7R49_07380 [Candidatus Daviesbacteria bacterium]|nr:hypothetical protein [Candidatus Daviesbacteria bacterium]
MDNIVRFLDIDNLKSYKKPLLKQPVEEVICALSEFMECIRYLNTRRSKTNLILDSEDAIQDAIYLMLRPWVVDIRPENPTDKIANRFVVKDFLLPSINTVIEAKYIRDKNHGKRIVQEINDDIETYRYHNNCENLIFFIYDPDAMIPDRLQLEKHVTSKRTYSDKVLNCFCIIKP